MVQNEDYNLLCSERMTKRLSGAFGVPNVNSPHLGPNTVGLCTGHG